MRLAHVCLALFCVPALSLLVCEWNLASLEDGFLEQAREHTAAFENVKRVDPAQLPKLPFAPAVAALVGIRQGSRIAQRVCGRESAYEPLFPQLHSRCENDRLYRRVRPYAALSLLAPVTGLYFVLRARAAVLRYARVQPERRLLWMVLRGLPLLLMVLAAVSWLGPVMFLWTKNVPGALGIVAIGFLLLDQWTRRSAASFVQPRQLLALKR